MIIVNDHCVNSQLASIRYFEIPREKALSQTK